MNFFEAMSDGLSDIAHGEGGKDVTTMWADLRLIVDRYSFKCKKCKKNKFFRDIENTLRWFAKEDSKSDECDLWTKCKQHIKTEKNCSGCRNKL